MKPRHEEEEVESFYQNHDAGWFGELFSRIGVVRIPSLSQFWVVLANLNALHRLGDETGRWYAKGISRRV